MKKTKHTTGPWRSEYPIVYSARGARLLNIDEYDCATIYDTPLMAAAPELLEALNACRNELYAMIEKHNRQDEADGSWLYDYQTVGEADVAISKATGGTP